MLSPLLFTLLTHYCTAMFSFNHIIKFGNDTSVVGLISNNDEMHYREEVAQLAEWCGANNLSLNVRQRRLWWTLGRNSGNHPPTDHRQLDCGESQQHYIHGGAHQRGPQLDHQHYITLQEGATVPILSPPAEKCKSPSTHPHHFLQRNHYYLTPCNKHLLKLSFMR